MRIGIAKTINFIKMLTRLLEISSLISASLAAAKIIFMSGLKIREINNE
jgi:hypothetical protein